MLRCCCTNYEDVRKETKEAIIKYMTTVPEVSVQPKVESPVYVQASTPSNDEEEVEET